MSDEKVNLNQASIPELAASPGIGEKLAAKIVEYREEQQPFSEVADLAAVTGISEQMVNEIGDRLTVGDVGGSEEKLEPGTEVGALDEEGLPSPEAETFTEGETTTIIEVSPEGEAVLIVKAAPETTLPAEPEVEATEQEGISSPTEGEVSYEEGIPPEEEAAAEAETEPEMVEATAATAESETEPDAELESEAIIILEPDAEETTLEEEPAVEISTPAEAVTVTQSELAAGYILSALAGAFLGAVLVLFFLLLVNRTLRFAGDTRANELQQQFNQEIKTLNQGQANLRAEANALSSELEDLNSQLATATAAQGALTESLSDAQADVVILEVEMQTANGALTGLDTNVTALEVKSVALDERLSTLAESAEDFNIFLNGMRDLLFTLQGPPPTLTATATISATGSPPVTVTPTPPVTTMPTRTPRPTATPLSLPTRTRVP